VDPDAPAVELRRDEGLSILSFNIRFDSPTDGRNRWKHRRRAVAELVDGCADIAGLQEVRRCPLGYLARHLRRFRWVGVGRDDGRRKGEFAPIFYRADRFERGERGTFWLSTTPDAPGTSSWESSRPRIATWVVLRERATGRELLHLNVHLDHRSAAARANGAKVIRKRLAQLAGGRPVVLTGDFNDGPGGEAHAILTDPAPADGGPVLVDARHVSLSGHDGPDSTWTGFEAVKEGRVIDFVLVSTDVTVLRHRSMDGRLGARFLSDHLPVHALVALPLSHA
jgi:endonuclease/exonuclease/phosphatase family metal-dependent hydrolase